MKASDLLVAVLLLAACGDRNGAGSGPAAPEGPWAGTWVISGPLNTDSRYAACSVTMASYEGELVYDPMNPPVCEIQSIRVRQSGSLVTIEPTAVVCSDNSALTVEGEVYINGTAFTAILEWREAGIHVITDSFIGTRSDTTVTMAQYARAIPGGDCGITPELWYTAIIQP